MKTFTRTLIFCVLFSLALTACVPKEDTHARWYKGNLHTHSYWSDGDEFPEMVMDWYKSHGYNFVALSDHNIIPEGEKWITVPKSRLYEEGFTLYLTRFGENWVTYKMDSGRTVVKLKTLSEYKPQFEDENFLIMPSEEITDGYGERPIHLNATNIQNLILPQGGISVMDVLQRNIDEVLRQRTESGVPMFPHINHPNFYYGVSMEDIMGLKGERFFEVYNGHPAVQNYGDSLHPGTEMMWDLINVEYYIRKQPLLYGLATDDSHNYHQFGAAYSNAGRGWVMVQADSLSPEALIKAMEKGAFYATTGVLLDAIDATDNTLSIKVKSEPQVTYEIRFVGVTRADQKPHVLTVVQGDAATFDLTDDYLFVRAKVISDKAKPNPFQEGDYEMAWTQPVTFREN